uniref:Uncharacterized protein n=1 Tax=Myoviridae sp. ctwVB15 TaxID=2825208 RepID=A0A8S5UNA8_9CAUD|nr:MAG TPA: hypothetical protein [Myoviridae sp. ctwVB15]
MNKQSVLTSLRAYIVQRNQGKGEKVAPKEERGKNEQTERFNIIKSMGNFLQAFKKSRTFGNVLSENCAFM